MADHHRRRRRRRKQFWRAKHSRRVYLRTAEKTGAHARSTTHARVNVLAAAAVV